MLYYEWKKIWVKPGTKIAMLLLAAVLAITCLLAVCDVYFVDENGEHEYGIGGAHKLKAAQKEWTGELTEEVIAKVIAENNRINATEEYNSDDVRVKNIAYGWKLGFHDIRYLIMYSFCEFQEGDYYKPDSLVPEDASRFYENRLLHLQEWLKEPFQENKFSKEEKEFLVKRYEELEAEAPFFYDYAEGWKQALTFSVTIIMLMMLILGFAAAGIFAGEFRYKADAIFYSSYHGRKRATAAKLGAGLLFVTVVYFVTMALYTLILFGTLGTDGAGLIIQTNYGNWKSFYSLTNLQEYALVVIGGYIGTLFILLLTMLVSVMSKSTALAATVPFIMLFLPNFLRGGDNAVLNKIIGILPDRLLDIAQAVDYFDLYSLGNKIVGALNVIFPLYAMLIPILCLLIYRIYRRMEAG